MLLSSHPRSGVRGAPRAGWASSCSTDWGTGSPPPERAQELSRWLDGFRGPSEGTCGPWTELRPKGPGFRYGKGHAHPPLQSPPAWAPIPAHQALPVLSPFSIKECHTTTTPSSISPSTQPVSLAQMQVCSPQNMPPLPSALCTKRVQVRSCAPICGLPPSQLLEGAWLVQSSQLEWGQGESALVSMG